jgi:hypothetical protein
MILPRTRVISGVARQGVKTSGATEHPIVRSFQPGEDWIWWYVDEVVVEPDR